MAGVLLRGGRGRRDETQWNTMRERGMNSRDIGIQRRRWAFMILYVAVMEGSVCTAVPGQQQGEKTPVTKELAAESASVMCQAWTGPYGGVPPWHLVQPDQFVAAFDNAIAMAQQEIEVIARNPAPPTFDNTIVALEKAGRSLDRLQAIFGVHASNLNLGPMPEVQRVVMPKLAEFEDSITQNEQLFARIAAVYESDEMSSLTTAQRRLAEDRYKTFVRQGAKLNAEDKARLAKMNKRLASLFADFSQHVLDDERDYVTWIDDAADLDGLPQSIVDGMAAAAAERGRAGKWAVTNTRSSMEPFLTYANHRGLREQVWRNYYSRGDNGDARDNNGIISEILKLRARTGQAAGLPDPCSLASRAADGQDTRGGDGVDVESLAQGSRARTGRSCRHATDR